MASSLLQLKKWMEMETEGIDFEDNVDFGSRKVAAAIATRSRYLCIWKERHMAKFISYLALSYYDKLLYTNSIPTLANRNPDYVLRVVAMCCLFIAMRKKYTHFGEADMDLESERILWSPDIEKEDVMMLGKQTMKALGPLTECVNALFFVPGFLSFIGENRRSRKLTVVDLILGSQHNLTILKYLPSEIAASAVMITMKLDLQPEDRAMFVTEFGLNITHIKECIMLINHCFNLGEIPTPMKLLSDAKDDALATKRAEYNKCSLINDFTLFKVMTDEEWAEQQLVDLNLDWVFGVEDLTSSALFKETFIESLSGWLIRFVKF